MHFHATNAAPQRSASPSGRRSESESLLLPLQPGRLLSIKQQAQHLQQLQQQGSPIKAKKPNHAESNQRNSDATKASAVVPVVSSKPEPINYLRLRRTEESNRALQRNRTQLVVTHEILQPSASSPALLSPTKAQASIAEQKEAVQRMDRVLEEMELRVLAKYPQETQAHGEDPRAFMASHLQQLYREQAQVERESKAASQRVQATLTVVRNDISLMYKFTPLFKIYARHKTKSAWLNWRKFVLWHRDEQERLALLWPYAVKIQRVFRLRRGRWLLARARMAAAWAQWQASTRIQQAARVWLSRRERERRAEIREATKLQAAWRGRRDRRWIKKLLQDELRRMLRSLTPTGNLHRLHELMRSNPELARPLNAMLSLIEETTVSVESNAVYKAKNARIAAKNAAKPVEATRKQLFHAVFELSEIILTRQRGVQAKKDAYVRRQEEKQRQQKQEEDEIKAKQLRVITEKINAENENARMRAEELLTREYLRMLRTADTDHILHLTLAQKRKEEGENARMVVEEYQTRYLVSELRRRKQEDERRLGEVEKRHQFLQEQEHQQTQVLMELLKTDEMKRNEIRNKRLQAKAEENELWSKMSKEQQAEAIRRLELKEQLEEEEKKRAEGILYAQQAYERELNRKREESRRRKQDELDRELHTREEMDTEDKRSRKVHFEMKKALHAEMWKAKREKEQVRYSLDPMHFNKIQEIKQREERERRERYMMKKEDELMAAIHAKERKERYFEECRQRRKQEQADAKRAHKETLLMEEEDKRSMDVREAQRKGEEHKLALAKMAVLAEQDESNRKRRVMEARNRKLMHDEEMRQRRVELAIQIASEAREKRERETMEHEENHTINYNARMAKKAQKRFRERCIFQMMKEDVLSMECQDIEDEGHRLEELLWQPADAAAFSNLVMEYPSMLATNVAIVKELCSLKGSPPFNFDYDSVREHHNDEASLPLDKVPRKKRKPRKFFYHEFFEDDPILSKLKPPPLPPSKARERWKKLAEHFCGRVWSSDSVRRSRLLMSQHKYGEATEALLEAIRMSEASAVKKPTTPLLRQLARCCLRHWEATLNHLLLEKALYYFQRASCHFGVLANPSFLQEIASVLEKAGHYREAAQVIAGIIGCFPRYAKLHEVIFRGGIIMISLRMYPQSREYVMHSLDTAPFGWEQHEVLFLAARVMQLEGKLKRKLCSVAYDEAFRTNKREAYYRMYPTWREWIKNPDTWRDAGDRYYAKHEFALARDAYEVMMKRILKTKRPANAKRQQVIDARKPVEPEKIEDGDWLRIARCAAILNDRAGAATALKRWFMRKSYRERVMEQLYAWPLARWKLLGVEVPERVMEVLEQKKKEAQDAEAAKLRAIQERRQMILKQRSVKARERRIAWGDDVVVASGSTVPVAIDSAPTVEVSPQTPMETHQPERVGAWLRVADEHNIGEVYYWNEETGEVSWDPPPR